MNAKPSTTSPRKRAAIKAVRMWVNPVDLEDRSLERLTLTKRLDDRDHLVTITPVAVLDMSDPEALVTQASRHIFYNVHLREGNSCEIARAVLTSLGVLPAKRTRKST